MLKSANSLMQRRLPSWNNNQTSPFAVIVLLLYGEFPSSRPLVSEVSPFLVQSTQAFKI
ncbi:hypothetical protein CSUI_005702, partial [Cystoisospora suis]